MSSKSVLSESMVRKGSFPGRCARENKEKKEPGAAVNLERKSDHVKLTKEKLMKGGKG